MPRQNMKMSHLTEHSTNKRTDGLYEPLRNALKKSGMPMMYESRRHSLTPQKLQFSHLTHNIHMLSQMQADRIQKTTFIAADRELVPTHHIEKVAGKHFYAVDVEERVGQPMTEEEWNRMRGMEERFQEIVWEFKESGVRGSQEEGVGYKGGSLFDLPNMSQSRSVQNLKTVHTNASGGTFQRPILKSGVKQAQSEVYQQQYQFSSMSKPGPYSTSSKIKVPATTASKDLAANQMLPYTINESNNNSSSQSRASNLTSSVGAYKFDQKMKATRTNNRLELKGKKGQEKYNLFSIIDEPLNYGCGAGGPKNKGPVGCWGGNELCAPRRAGNQWK